MPDLALDQTSTEIFTGFSRSHWELRFHSKLTLSTSQCGRICQLWKKKTGRTPPDCDYCLGRGGPVKNISCHFDVVAVLTNLGYDPLPERVSKACIGSVPHSRIYPKSSIGWFMKYSASARLLGEYQAHQAWRVSRVSGPMRPLPAKSRSVRAEFCSRASAKAWHVDKWLQKLEVQIIKISTKMKFQAAKTDQTTGGSWRVAYYLFSIRVWVQSWGFHSRSLKWLWCEWSSCNMGDQQKSTLQCIPFTISLTSLSSGCMSGSFLWNPAARFAHPDQTPSLCPFIANAVEH